MRRWTEEEIEKLKEMYAILPNEEIGRTLARSFKGVTSMAKRLGLKKGPERLRTMGRENAAKRGLGKPHSNPDHPWSESRSK